MKSPKVLILKVPRLPHQLSQTFVEPKILCELGWFHYALLGCVGVTVGPLSALRTAQFALDMAKVHDIVKWLSLVSFTVVFYFSGFVLKMGLYFHICSVFKLTLSLYKN